MSAEEDSLMFSEDDYEDDDYVGDSRSEYELDDGQEVVSSRVQSVVLTEEDIKLVVFQLCEKESLLLSIPFSHTKALLRYFHWDVNRLHDEWFSNEEKVRKSVGLPSSNAPANTSAQQVCGICFDTFTADQMFSLRCSHAYCKNCWKSYIESSIMEGPSCLQLRCVEPSCNVLVTEDIIKGIGLGDELTAKYDLYTLRSYVEESRKVQWCPAPGCTRAVECFEVLGNNTPLDVRCYCGCDFCFSCSEEPHRPADCNMRKKWIIKNTAESENLNWILANSKPCPKCKRPIEKNHGCMHMTCAVCKHEFCWLCLGAWGEHGERTGGFYACNKYEAAKAKGEKSEDNKRRDFARASLERYMHYFERWAANQSSCDQAQKSLEDFVKSDSALNVVSENTSMPISQLKFITDAWNQVIQCRRTLMWTYAYGYYNFSKSRAGNLKDFFEFLQGEAEYNLELLHNCIEVELQKFAHDQCGRVPQDVFNEFRSKLTGLTKVTSDYFDKLVYELENGLEEIQTKYGSFDESTLRSPSSL